MSMKLQTLCLVHRDGKVLLGMKKRGFGAGKWNGFGGKVQQGEFVNEAAERELTEECGIVATELELMGNLIFEYPTAGDEEVEVAVYRVNSFTGEPKETGESRPQWFKDDAVPYQDMWADDEHWLPLFLKGQKFFGKFTYDKAGKLVSHDLRPSMY